VELPTMSIPLNGAAYHVRDSGGSGPPVVLAHGMPDSGEMWRHQWRALSEAGYRVVCPDLLGCGRTDRPEELQRYETTAIVGDVLALLEALDLHQVHYVGHDWGAVVGWELALTYPDRLLSAAQISVGHPIVWLQQGTRFEYLRWNWYMLFNLSDDAPEAYRADGGRLARELLASHPEREAVIERFAEPGRLEAMLRWDRANALPKAVPLLAAIDGIPPCTVPTLGVFGVEDRFLWEEQMTATAGVMDAEWRYERIEHAGHWVPLERPDEVNRLLIEWLASRR